MLYTKQAQLKVCMIEGRSRVKKGLKNSCSCRIGVLCILKKVLGALVAFGAYGEDMPSRSLLALATRPHHAY